MVISDRREVGTGTIWESLAGYVRALRIGAYIWISGTTATDANGHVVGDGDAAVQTRYILQIIESALIQLGASRENIVRTRIYVRDVADWEVVAREHGHFFSVNKPANTLIEARLVGDEYLVEVEADAIVD